MADETTTAAAPAATTASTTTAPAATTSEPARPDSIDVHSAVEMMAGGLADDEPVIQTDGAATTSDAPAGEGGTAQPAAADTQIPASAADANAAPEFWAAEDKALFAQVPEALRPVLAKYEKQRGDFLRDKQREAATGVNEARQVAEGAFAIVQENAKWWQANREGWEKSFGDKWAQVNWDDLAVNNPGEHTRLSHERAKERQLLDEANRRGQEAQRLASERAQTARQTARRAEHAKIAAKLPEFFSDKVAENGKTVAENTYDELGNFLVEAGLPVERVNAIWEAPIIELALDAMRYRKAKKQASTVLWNGGQPATTAGPANTSATTSTVRVPPGPAKPAANQEGERQRQARQRISTGASIDARAAAALLNDLNL